MTWQELDYFVSLNITFKYGLNTLSVALQSNHTLLLTVLGRAGHVICSLVT